MRPPVPDVCCVQTGCSDEVFVKCLRMCRPYDPPPPPTPTQAGTFFWEETWIARNWRNDGKRMSNNFVVHNGRRT
jgi:hypothetical protein